MSVVSIGALRCKMWFGEGATHQGDGSSLPRLHDLKGQPGASSSLRAQEHAHRVCLASLAGGEALGTEGGGAFRQGPLCRSWGLEAQPSLGSPSPTPV